MSQTGFWFCHIRWRRLPQCQKVQADVVPQVSSTLGKFGTKVLAGSKDIFEQVAEAVQSELDGMEGHIAKPRKSNSSRTAKYASKIPCGSFTMKCWACCHVSGYCGAC